MTPHTDSLPRSPLMIHPLAAEIDAALSPGYFIGERRCVRFVEDLEEVRDEIAGLLATGEAAIAVRLCDRFLDAAIVKAAEVDDSGGDFGRFMGDLLCDWIQARQAAGAPGMETANLILARVDADEWGYCGAMGDRLADALDDTGRVAFAAVAARRANGASDADRRWAADTLRAVHSRQRNPEAYLAACTTLDHLKASDCLRLAKMAREARDLPQALAWVERGLGMSADRDASFAAFKLRRVRRAILSELDRGPEALADAWLEYTESPSRSTLEELRRWTPDHEWWAWRSRALDVLDTASVSEKLEVFLAAGDVAGLAAAVGEAAPDELAIVDSWTALRVIDALEEDYGVEAAHMRAALARGALREGKSKRYPGALRHLEDCRDALIAAGREAEWETLAEEIRREHGRKWSFMREFEEMAPAPPGQ